MHACIYHTATTSHHNATCTCRQICPICFQTSPEFSFSGLFLPKVRIYRSDPPSISMLPEACQLDEILWKFLQKSTSTHHGTTLPEMTTINKEVATQICGAIQPSVDASFSGMAALRPAQTLSSHPLASLVSRLSSTPQPRYCIVLGLSTAGRSLKLCFHGNLP